MQGGLRSSGLCSSVAFVYLHVCVSIDPGPHKGKVVQLSTGRARVHSKTDCWISFDQYMEFARCLLILCGAETSKVLLVDWAVFAWLKIYL